MEPHLLARVTEACPGARGTARSRTTWGADLSTPTQAPDPARPHAGGMLWSDPENEPPKELRDAQRMLRRLGLLLALAMVLAMIVLGVR